MFVLTQLPCVLCRALFCGRDGLAHGIDHGDWCLCSAPGVGYRDFDLEENATKFEADLHSVFTAVASGQFTGVVLPGDGLGTGVAALQRDAPRTWARLCEAVRILKEMLDALSSET